MKLTKLTLHNYRQYRGPCEIDLTTQDGAKHFVVIEGPNGAGKSNLLNAITWCLYLEETHLKGKARVLPVPNAAALKEAGKKSVQVSVELHMQDDDGTPLMFRRIADFLRSDSGSQPAIPGTQSLTGKYLEGRDWKSFADAEFWVQSHLPPTIKDYFFFDGEKLDRYFQEASNTHIREAVNDIAQITLLEKTLGHLKQHNANIGKQEDKGQSPVAQLSEQIQDRTVDLEQLREEIKKVEAQKEQHEQELETVNTLLRDSPVKLVQELQGRRQKLQDRLETLDNRIDDEEKERADQVLTVAPAMLGHAAIAKALEQIGKHKDAGRIPPEFTRVFIDHLVKNRECICGTPLTNHSKELARVLELRRETDEVSELVREILDMHGELLRVTERTQGFAKLQSVRAKRLRELRDEYEEKAKELKGVDQQVQGIDVADIQKAENRRGELVKRVTTLQGQIGQWRERARTFQEEIDAKTEQRKAAMAKESRYGELRERISILEKAENLAVRVRDKIVEQVRSQVEDSTRKHFFELIWKKSTFREISITPDYGISVIHESGLESMDSLSAGERQVLALSFMAALNDVSGFNVPIVIDTPLGRISDEPTSAIARNLPKYLPGRQVILLVTDKEYASGARKELLPAVAREFKITVASHGDETTSTVVPYGA